MTKQRGIALVQVLLIVAVVSILALYFTQSARQQVKSATMMVDKAQALIELNNAQANIVFSLLTEKLTPIPSPPANNPQITTWNFYSEPFKTTNNVEVRLQDLRGLLNIHYPNQVRLKRLLTYSGLNDYDAQLAMLQIIAWQSLEKRSDYISDGTVARNAAIHDIEELGHLGLPSKQLSVLAENTTQYKKGTFNPMNSPNTLLYALLSNEVAEYVIMQRKANRLTVKDFVQATGITESDDIILYPSNLFRVSLTSRVGQAVVNKTIYFHLQPTKDPVINEVAVKTR
ncbi:type II secretion system protein GspK [Pseudoalteromonas gelatinilytica]|uniref:General secretion pathway protein GspK n=1 Tax=Pseudoalteromonas gelatinilytica TaxID=1703256 RepID=A0A3A3EUL9_9GAMM|nr:type II secretion system protein GspK [Pseudoalteromonas profundi]RJF38024.1 hypothetical protein D4741_08165 [Pseudoalteromonas profundi]